VAKSGVDGVYTADPHQDPTAQKLDQVTYAEAIARGLRIMDQTAFALCGENKLPMVVFGMEPEGNILRVVQGEKIGTLVSADG
jgi:uridylate kinase